MKQQFVKKTSLVTQLIYASILGVTATAMFGCSGGGGGGTTTPAAATVDPANGETGVEPDVVIMATFTVPVVGSDVDAATFTLEDDSGNPVTGAVMSDGSTATLTPNSNLGILRTYNAALSGTIEKSSGGPITGMNWSFTTRDGAWTTEENIENETGNATSAQIAADENGNFMAIWYQDGDNSVYSNYYDASTGWTADSVMVNAASGVSGPQVAFDKDGWAVAVWTQNVSMVDHVYFNRYEPGVGWGTPEPVEANTANASDPQLAIDGFGNVIVVWKQNDGSAIPSVWANRFDNTTDTWDGEQQIDNGDDDVIFSGSSGSNSPAIAIDDGGDAIAVWVQDDGAGNSSVYAAYYTSGGAWAGAQQIDSVDYEAKTPKIATDRDGTYIVVWRQQDAMGGSDSAWTNRYDGSWQGAQELDSNSGIISNPMIAFDSSGNAMAVWDGGATLGYSTYNGTTMTWSADASIASGGASASFHHFAMDPEGHAMVVWREVSNAVNSAWYSRYQKDTGWGTAALLETVDNATTDEKVAIDNQGNAIAIWIRSDGSVTSVYSARFE